MVVSMPASSQNLVLKAPTAHHVTLRLNAHTVPDGLPGSGGMVLEPARSGEDTWQFGVVSWDWMSLVKHILVLRSARLTGAYPIYPTGDFLD